MLFLFVAMAELSVQTSDHLFAFNYFVSRSDQNELWVLLFVSFYNACVGHYYQGWNTSENVAKQFQVGGN